jgi:hypothetical protein
VAHPRAADGGDGLQMWRVVLNILNKQSRTADKGWSPSVGVGRGADYSPWKNRLLRNINTRLAGCCEHGNKRAGSIKGEKLLD